MWVLLLAGERFLVGYGSKLGMLVANLALPPTDAADYVDDEELPSFVYGPRREMCMWGHHPSGSEPPDICDRVVIDRGEGYSFWEFTY